MELVYLGLLALSLYGVYVIIMSIISLNKTNKILRERDKKERENLK